MKPTNKKLKTALRIGLIVLAAAVLGVNLYTWNLSLVSGNTVPMPFGVGAAVVVSGSMEPALSAGDLIIVAEREDYAVGDVIVFQDGRMAVTHRITAVADDTVTTKGDANNTEDSPIHRAQIKGKVVAAVPLAGYVVNAIKTPLGTLALLALAVVLMESSFRAEKQKDADELAAIRAEIERLKKQQTQNHE